MDPRLVTMALVAVVVAVAALAVALVVFLRRRTTNAVEADQATWSSLKTPAGGTPAVGGVMAAPAAVVVAPCEELLSPLSTGVWRPPDEPAPAALLPAISLAERTRGFDRRIPEVAPPIQRVVSPQSPREALVPQPVLAPTAPAEPDVPLYSESAFGSAPASEPNWRPLLATFAPTPASPIAETPSAPVVPERPHAHSRPLPDAPTAPATPDKLVWPDEPASPPVRPGEFVAMVAPVEMWFGDYRVGVKAGSKTHAQFRKYADALLGELKDEDERAR